MRGSRGAAVLARRRRLARRGAAAGSRSGAGHRAAEPRGASMSALYRARAWTGPASGRVAAQEGSALVMALGAMGVIVTLGLAVSLTVSVETDIASNAHAAVQALSLAEAAAETAVAELSALASWDGVLAGAVTAASFDGAHGRRRAGGADIDLDRETAWLRCGAASCDGRQPDAMTAARPWGRNNAMWTVYLSGGASDLLRRRRAGIARLCRGLGWGRPGGERRRPPARRRPAGGGGSEPRSTPGPVSSCCGPSPGAPEAAAASWRSWWSGPTRKPPPASAYGPGARSAAPFRDCSSGRPKPKQGTMRVLILLFVSMWATGAFAQSLGDVARQEAERRKTVKAPGKVYTNDVLKAEPLRPRRRQHLERRPVRGPARAGPAGCGSGTKPGAGAPPAGAPPGRLGRPRTPTTSKAGGHACRRPAKPFRARSSLPTRSRAASTACPPISRPATTRRSGRRSGRPAEVARRTRTREEGDPGAHQGCSRTSRKKAAVRASLPGGSADRRLDAPRGLNVSARAPCRGQGLPSHHAAPGARGAGSRRGGGPRRVRSAPGHAPEPPRRWCSPISSCRTAMASACCARRRSSTRPCRSW